MKVKVQATVTFQWEEDSDNWGNKANTPAEILASVKDYAKDDMNYILESEIIDYDIELAE